MVTQKIFTALLLVVLGFNHHVQGTNCYSRTINDGGGTITVYVTFKPGGDNPTAIKLKERTEAELENKCWRVFNPSIPFEEFLKRYTILWYDHNAKHFVEFTKNHVLQDYDILEIRLEAQQISPAVVDHSIHDGDHVYIWSSFSHKNQGLVKKGVKHGNAYKVECNGLSTDNDNLIRFEVVESHLHVPGKILHMLTLPSSTKKKMLAIKGHGEDLEADIQEIDENAYHKDVNFEIIQFFSYTLIRWHDESPGGRDDLYLAAFRDGTMKVIKGGKTVGFPNPSTLFILVKN